MEKKHLVSDEAFLAFWRKRAGVVSRLAIFLVFAWFGFLKVIEVSPAEDLVLELLHRTLPFIGDHVFMIGFGVFEVLIGILFLFPKLTRLAVLLFVLHMVTTFLPLIFLPTVAWQGAFVPTLVGQYILKNVALIALVLNIAIHLQPMKLKMAK